MSKAFSMKEIAWQAGIGLATVDRVLHDRPGVSPAMRRRVQQACLELERQHQQVGLKGRRFLIDLVMEAPSRFSRMVRDTLAVAVQRMPPAVFRVREHLAETMALPELIAVLDTIGRRGSQGVLLKAPDVPAVTEAVARLQARGIPVVTLVTDLREAPRRAYVGLDNHRAGQTAAYLTDQWLGPSALALEGAPTDVLVSSSGPHFQGEGERIAAFVQALGQSRPASRVHVMDTGHGLHAPTREAVGQLLARCPAVAAVYSVGGANAAILAAFEAAGRPCRVFIGHDLDDDNLALLRAGRLSAVLHHDLHHDLHLACRLVMQAHGVAHAVSMPTRSNVEVITPFNVPAHRLDEARLNPP
ncbi:LacI family DNA-binding transcriptional regulator [Sphaerotilus sp.]|uniref:LacI family DNA-binding transcriptional regulator n=1 Tax=Sphaerotilus sp. TaxID=2093942 RepID=UPI00286DEFE6|nr:LacI family DNA-binding transcriptional regulator [Sphaerotilus sp.]